MKFSTTSINSGNKPNLKAGGSGDVIIPIHLSTTFARKKIDNPTAGYEYSRSGNPTRYALEKNLTNLEEGKWAYAFSSGLSAITAVLLTLQKGDHVVSIDDVYGGTRRLFNQVFANFGIEFTYGDFANNNELRRHVKTNTKLIWIESPTNPLLKIVDIASVCQFAREKNIITVVDNTFASPYFQRPLKLGATISLHSMTKYIGGHSDVIAGCIIGNDKILGEKIKFIQNAAGAILSPFDSFQILKGIKTLSLRMEKHEEIAKSLGVVESLIEHPASMTHASIPRQDREKIGLSDGLIRLSVGIEDAYDLIRDLNQALKII